jgi:tetratricopeptide (TPR) repeat protein
MTPHRTGNALLPLLLIALLCAAVAAPARGAADALVEAKRKAAADLMRDGKTADAISLISEVTKADPGNYKDYLLLARAYDKAGKAAEAVEAYRKMMDLPGAAEDRVARPEAERRLKALDAQSGKIKAAEEEFLKKLDQLERESIAAKDARAVRHVFRLKGGIYRAGDRKDRTGYEVAAGPGWQDTGFVVRAGKTYKIRAVGTFTVKPGLDSGPEGTDAVPANYQGPVGVLMAKVADKPAVAVGSAYRLTAEATGPLVLLLNPSLEGKPQSSGTVTVLVEAE